MARILIAEDDRDIRELIEIMLRFHNFDVLPVSDGIMALEATERERFDLIILDVRMPRLDGYAACRRLRNMESTRELPILMLSAKGQESEIEEGLAAGADEYILKPFTPETLIATINGLIKGNVTKDNLEKDHLEKDHLEKDHLEKDHLEKDHLEKDN